MSDKPLIVVALGGNAISQAHEEGNVDQQFANSRITAKALADLVESGNRLLVTHGNGPQIGNFLLRNEAAAETIYPLPMEVAVAHVQGGMGFMIAQTLMNELSLRGIDQSVTAIITTVLVAQDDPAFERPTKPVGRVLPKEEADDYMRDEGWRMKEVSPGQFRRVVPSPKPRRIMEIKNIRRAVEAEDILVACGGGGIPIVRDDALGLMGVRAVIDKDLATAVLAAELGADRVMILTNVDRVCIDFGKPTQKELSRMRLGEAERHMAEGQFPEGSMGPKVQGAIDFLKASNKENAEVVIGPLHQAGEAIAGRTGTRVTR